MPAQHSTQRQNKGGSIANRVATTSTLNLLFYPIQVVRTLIQVGHEPLAPRVYKSMFFRKEFVAYPGFVPYVRHLYNAHGLLGLYSGSQHFVGSQITFLLTSELLKEPTERIVHRLAGHLGLTMDQDTPDNEDGVTDFRHLLKKAVVSFTVSSVVDTAATVVSHPLRVVALRSISQLVGGETLYSGFLHPYQEILSEEGLQGLFSGVVPLVLARIINNLIREGLGLLLAVVVGQAVGLAQNARPIIPHVSSYCATLAMYPLIYTSTLMVIRPARLQASVYPLVPQTTGWLETFRTLRSRRQLFHGTSVIALTRAIRKTD